MLSDIEKHDIMLGSSRLEREKKARLAIQYTGMKVQVTIH